MNISVFDGKSEIQFYQELVKSGYPEDRIAKEYPIENLRVDFAILPPGLNPAPMAVFEVKRNMQDAITWLNRSQAIKQMLKIPFYIYCVEDKITVNGNTKKAIQTQNWLPQYDKLLHEWLNTRTSFSNLKLENFMIFESADLTFSPELNVIIGENGSGKTQLLRLIYSIARAFTCASGSKLVRLDYSKFKIKEIFGATKYDEFISRSSKSKKTEANISFALFGQNRTESFSIKDKINISVAALETMLMPQHDAVSAVFIPPHELLSIFPGFNSLDQVYRGKWSYDQTYSDCMAYLGLPAIPSQNKFSGSIIREVEKAIHGHIYLNEQGTRFLMQLEKSKDIYEIPMVAEGWRKFGQLLQLINTGAIHPGSILVWDEPEANLNPRLICLVAKVLMKLSKLGIQVFMTTHNLFLLRELEYLSYSDKRGKNHIRYFSMQDGNVEQGNSSADLSNIASFEEEISQEDRILSYKG